MEPSEIRRQVRHFHDAGFSGFFMHARNGLSTDYLGREWFDAIRAAVDEARSLGMEAWLYDEDRYASGSGSGEIGRDIRLRRRTLEAKLCDRPCYCDGDLAWFAGTICGAALYGVRQLHCGDAIGDGESFLRFFVKYDEPNSWNNGGYYSDMMNPETIRRFIAMTHDRYAERFAGDFGTTIPGIFSDEPNCTNWTDGMMEKFRRRWGVELLPRLPELFFEVDGNSCSGIRWKFHCLRAELLESSFACQIASWCHGHGLKFTGHVFGEEDVVTQARNCGSQMRFIRHLDLPGMDVLSDHQLVYDAAIQTSSVAHQTGVAQCISESFGGSGWEMTLYARKACMDWQLALGVTRFCVHHALYTIRGEAKRDFPPGISFQSSCWEQERKLQDYAELVGKALGEGRPVRPVLVVHPVESTWIWKPLTVYSLQDQIDEGQRLPRLRNALLAAKIGFDYGDEAMMADDGAVADGVLRVGCARYAAVVLPQMRVIRRRTLELLSHFVRQGGRVFYLGEAPQFCDGEECPQLIQGHYCAFSPVSLDELSSELHFVRSVSLSDGEGEPLAPVLASEVAGKDGQRRLFLCNTGTALPLDSQMTAPGSDRRALQFPQVRVRWRGGANAAPMETDFADGRLHAIPDAEYGNGWWQFTTSLGRLQSRLFVACVQPEIAQPGRADMPKAEDLQCIWRSDGPWQYKLNEPNALPLDFAEYSIDGGVWHDGNVREADDAVRRHLGVLERGGEMVQPWKQRYLQDNAKAVPVVLRFHFHCRHCPPALSLALEESDRYRIALNGAAVAKPPRLEWWCDPSLGVVPLPVAALRPGDNLLELHCDFCGAMSGFESLFLLGRFGVDNNCLAAAPMRLIPGDWGLQGFPYYSGKIIYHVDFDDDGGCVNRTFLSVGPWMAAAIAIAVNGNGVPHDFIPPAPLEITHWLKKGANCLEITLYGSRRNAFGPFVSDPGPLIGPYLDFSGRGPAERTTVPYGLMGAIAVFRERSSAE